MLDKLGNLNSLFPGTFLAQFLLFYKYDFYPKVNNAYLKKREKGKRKNSILVIP
jgi:hypothetical protein